MVHQSPSRKLSNLCSICLNFSSNVILCTLVCDNRSQRVSNFLFSSNISLYQTMPQILCKNGNGVCYLPYPILKPGQIFLPHLINPEKLGPLLAPSHNGVCRSFGAMTYTYLYVNSLSRTTYFPPKQANSNQLNKAIQILVILGVL